MFTSLSAASHVPASCAPAVCVPPTLRSQASGRHIDRIPLDPSCHLQVCVRFLLVTGRLGPCDKREKQ